MKQDTRDLGMVATVWVIAAIAVLALGRVDVPAGPIAGHDDGVPLARSIEATVPPTDDIRDPGHRGWEQEIDVADRLPTAEAVPRSHLPADDELLGSEPRASVSLAERHPWATAAARATSMDGGPAGGHEAATHPRAADGPPKPKPVEAKPEPKPVEEKPEPEPVDAKPKSTEPEPKLTEPIPEPELTKLNPTKPKSKPVKPKPVEAKPRPVEAKPKPPEPKPELTEPKPEPELTNPKPPEPKTKLHPKPNPKSDEPRPEPEPESAKPGSARSKPD